MSVHRQLPLSTTAVCHVLNTRGGPISTIASQSSKLTTDTMQQTLQLLDYLATQEDAVLSYHASDMVLAVHSNASYLSEPKARSRAGGHFFLSSDTTIPPNNGAVLNIVHIIKNVMSRGSGGSSSPLFLFWRENSKIRKPRKRGKIDGPRTDNQRHFRHPLPTV